MCLLCLHSEKSVEICSTQKIEKSAFYAVCEIVPKDELIDIVLFCLLFEFFISPLSELGFASFFISFSRNDSELCVLEKIRNEFFISEVSRSGVVITMYKK